MEDRTGVARSREFASSRFCHLCGRQLVGRYVRYETGLTVCQSCETTRPRCARCAVPLPDRVIATRTPSAATLCAECSRSTPRCAACRQPILGVFYSFEELLPASGDRKFCARCVQHRPRCDLCSAPVADGAAPVADGQWRCALCAADLLTAEDAVLGVYRQAMAAFARVVGSRLAQTPRLELVSRREMGALRRRYSRTSGATGGPRPESAGHHVLGYFVYSNGTSTIYVEHALPRPVLLGTLAHELGHAWQAERAPGLRDLLLCEGFAEWVAHRVLVGAGLQAAAARSTRRDDVYGRGLRHFLDLERTHGRDAVLAAIQSRA
jgi:hypothetical protein